jgi:non-structural maintenance of chromosomes element 4
LDNLRKSLKKVLKEAGTDRLNYYQFILDPTDFGKSVENMFYMSFLIKDGYVKFEVDPQTGLPDIGES